MNDASMNTAINLIQERNELNLHLPIVSFFDSLFLTEVINQYQEQYKSLKAEKRLKKNNVLLFDLLIIPVSLLKSH